MEERKMKISASEETEMERIAVRRWKIETKVATRNKTRVATGEETETKESQFCAKKANNSY